MKAYTLSVAVASIIVVSVLSFATPELDALAQESGQKGDKHIQIMTDAVEFAEYTQSAEKCKSKKGETIRVKVKSASPVDVRLYIAQPRGKWLPVDFQNQKQGDEITHYQCDRTPVYKIYARPAGSTGEWAKP